MAYPKRQITQEERQNILDWTGQGFTRRQICKKLKLRDKVFYRWCREDSELYQEILRLRSIHRQKPLKNKYHFNFDYFNQIDNQNKAYWLGFIWADGSVSSPFRQLRFSLNIRDKHIVEEFKEDIQAENPIKEQVYGQKHDAIINLCSYNLVRDLNHYNILKRKSFRSLLPLNIPNNFIRHFIRGVFDGDGSVYFDKKGQCRVNILGNKDLASWLKNIIDNNVLIKTHVRMKSENLSCLEINGNKQSKNFLIWLYKDSNRFLIRKYNKVKDLVNG